MLKLLGGVCVLAVLASPVYAGTIVTWQSAGELRNSTYAGHEYTGRVPDPFTPYLLNMTFDPASMTQTRFSNPGDNCNTVAVSASLTLGDVTFDMSGSGFTHATLPGSNCTPGYQETQFILGFLSPPPDNNPWMVVPFGFMELWYTDDVMRDAFPSTPTHTRGGGFQIRDQFGSFTMSAPVSFQAVAAPENPTPVPEPGTLTLFGLGLAAVVRRVRRSRAA